MADKYPIVDETASLGEAARAATQAGVGAVIVGQESGFSIVDVAASAEPRATIGEVALSHGMSIGGAIGGIGASFGSLEEHNLDLDRLDVVAGYKECSVDSSHVFSPSYPGSSCPMSDGGTLNLVMF